LQIKESLQLSVFKGRKLSKFSLRKREIFQNLFKKIASSYIYEKPLNIFMHQYERTPIKIYIYFSWLFHLEILLFLNNNFEESVLKK